MTSQQVLTITHISKRGTTQVMSYLLVERVIYDGSQDAAEHHVFALSAKNAVKPARSIYQDGVGSAL